MCGAFWGSCRTHALGVPWLPHLLPPAILFPVEHWRGGDITHSAPRGLGRWPLSPPCGGYCEGRLTLGHLASHRP